MAATPNYASTIITPMVRINTANTNRDGTGTLGTLVTADAAESIRIDDIFICALGTTTAGMIRMYISDNTTHNLINEIAMTAVTPSATMPA